MFSAPASRRNYRLYALPGNILPAFFMSSGIAARIVNLPF